MIKFKDNKENHDYLTINIKTDGGVLIMSEKLPTFAQNEIQKMYFDVYQFEKGIGGYISEVSFRKDSLLGQWLIKNYDQQKLIYEDLFVYYEKVVNALNIALFESNPISERILPLFKKQINASKQNLLKECDEEVIDYILEHDNFYEWIDNKEKQPEEYVVFENGEYSKKILVAGKQIVKK